ncbi:MAG: NAD(P)-binding domain-containing protein [Deltaproteobacteria bacterium]|nr:NAD(P)-binding domain-containing protein [Deltaproteobacteria bacterium]
MSLIRRLFAPKKLEPSYPRLPALGEDGQTTVPGIYALGELAGTPLVRLGLNAGHDLIQRVGPKLKFERPADASDDVYDVVIVGSGSSGFAATVAAKDLGLRYLTLEAASFANTFATMTKGKVLLAEPTDVPKRSRVFFEECRKEELLERWRTLRDEEQLLVREHEAVKDIKGKLDAFEVITAAGSYPTRRVLLCLGKAGNPRRLGVPGEREAGDRVQHRLLDPDDFIDKDIIIVGAGDVACEAAIALASPGHNRVTLSAIDKELTFPKERNVEAVRALEREGKLRLVLDSRVIGLDAHTATVEKAGQREEVAYDTLFEMIGAELPLGFLRKIGVRLAGDWTPGRWMALTAAFVFVYSLYALKSYGKGIVAWPFESLISPASYDAVAQWLFRVGFAPFSLFFSDAAMSDMLRDRGFQQGYLYSLLYTVLMLVFGYQAMIRWRNKAKDRRYQTYRYLTLLSFQVGFFLIVNVVGVHALSAKYAWRAWGLYQPFPLFFNTYFWWSPSDPTPLVLFFVIAGLLGTFVAIPLLARNHGKRFCTWVCGCGGLAETLGDRWRHLAAKGQRSRAWEFQGALVMAAAFIVGLVVVGAYQSSGGNAWWKTYNYVVDFWLVAVIPIGLYPFFGGKVWCRYWCPLAAYNGLLARLYGRLKIVSNKQCITCTECSTYCQVGVDVMAFAKNAQPFDNSNSACIQCGICIDVCPMGVLSFETSDGRAVDKNTK